jgi:proline dehydrogenase
MKLLTRLAKSFVAGETVDEALPRVKKMYESGLTTTLDILGESVEDREQADKAVQGYLDLLDAIHESGIPSHVSLKLTQMGLDIDDEYCYENMVKIVSKAKSYGTFVRFDMEGSPHTQRTLDIFHRISEQYDNVGIVLQAMLFRTDKDVDDLNKAKAKVRLCKGAYKEPKEIAHQKMNDIREAFKKLSIKLFQEGVYPAIATHDDKLIDWTKEYVKENNIPNDRYEFQFLFGIRVKTQHKLAEEGYTVRVYVPFGTHWLPYFYRRLRERKENVWFVIKNFFKS